MEVEKTGASWREENRAGGSRREERMRRGTWKGGQRRDKGGRKGGQKDKREGESGGSKEGRGKGMAEGVREAPERGQREQRVRSSSC